MSRAACYFRFLIPTLLLAGFARSAVGGDEPVVRVQIDPAQVQNRIDPKVYGHFLEHIYHSVNGGLWGELVWNRSFEQFPGAGRWSLGDGGELVQSSRSDGVTRVVGDPSWTDYEFTCEARKDGGAEGFLILFRAKDEQNFYWANLGGWGNSRHAIERGRTGERQHQVSRAVEGLIETGRWYRIKVRCEGPRMQVWLDDQPLLDLNDAERPHLAGAVGIGTWSTQARFRNLAVKRLDGTTLLEGLPAASEKAAVAKHWQPLGGVKLTTVTEDALNSQLAQGLSNAGPGEAGVSQSPLAIEAGETYRGSLWMRGQAADGLIVRLRRNGAGSPVLAEARLGAPTSDWREYSFQLETAADSSDAALEVVLSGPGSIALDQVSLMADPARAGGGFRPDLLKAVAELRPPVIRWPGGCFASPYRWKDGIGPQAKRGVYPRELWDDLDVNSLGTDEFIDLCRRVGAEPLIVINIGTPQWNEDADSHDFLQDALDWVEYCNGPADSKWGKVRAANGHPEPYNVKYWEIDNETWGLRAEGYAGYVKRFAPALRAKDPSIKLLMCGSGGLGERGTGQAFNRVLIDQCADLVDYISVHHYEDPGQFAEGPARFERFLSDLGRMIQGSSNPGLKVYVSEWNAQSTDARTGLYAGGLLNAFERVGDVLEIGGPALFLRHVSATGWDNAFINFDHTGWFPAPNYVVMKLWRDHYQPRRIADDGEMGALNGVATASEDGHEVVYKLVNPTDRPASVVLAVAGTSAVKSASLAVVASGGTSTRNTLEEPNAVRVEPGEATVSGQEVSFIAPPFSALCVRIERE